MKIDNDFDKYIDLKKEYDTNYLDVLSIAILKTIRSMKRMDEYYNKFKDKVDRVILNSSFNELKNLLWLKFCNEIRDYSDILKKLFENKRYDRVQKYILDSSFINYFINNGSYTALSITLHNLNKIAFNEKKWKNSFVSYNKMNKALNIDLNIIKKEFEDVINIFREIDGLKCSLQICLSNFSPILDFFDYLFNKIKN